MRKLELLAPAKDLATGIAAIDHGADAVYIGAPRYGARAAAGNTIADIAELCRYAHQFQAKVYVTTNTIVYDDELEDAKRMVSDLKQADVDALLVQDMAFLSPSFSTKDITLHASTQTDNRSAGKVAWLRDIGFRRVVLARELSVDEIRDIHHQEPNVELEVFVHGALCVSYSGVCYASQHCMKRSANRGECAQMCRMKYDLMDGEGKVVDSGRHFLSLKDMCRIDYLEELADAGVVSFKIEGRLKDIDYVKNVVSAYSQRLNAIIARKPDEYCRASLGRVTYHFTPNLNKTFNRGYTDYFLHGRKAGIASFDTPKAKGEFVGTVKTIMPKALVVAGTAAFANGDGLCFLDDNRQLVGFRVNRADGNHLFPLSMPQGLQVGMRLYRNNDEAFSKLLAGKTAERKIPIKMVLSEDASCFVLDVSLKDDSSHFVLRSSFTKELAQKPQDENIIRQLTKLGNTPFVSEEIQLNGVGRYFIPSKQLTEWRRVAIEGLQKVLWESVNATCRGRFAYLPAANDGQTLDKRQSQTAIRDVKPSYLNNVANHLAQRFYESQGISLSVDAFELTGGKPLSEPLVMQCRHCIRYELGYCTQQGRRQLPWREPLFLRLSDGRRFRLQFDCKKCQMNIYATT